MTRSRWVRRIAALTAFATGATAGVVAFALTPASAATVPVPMLCLTTAFGIDYDPNYVTMNVTISSPATVDAGDPFTVTYAPTAGPASIPLTITNAQVRATANITAERRSGGLSLSATGIGATSAPTTIAPYSAIPVPVPVSISVPSSGFAPGDIIDVRTATFTVDFVAADGGLTGAQVNCVPQGTAPVATSTAVQNNLSALPPDQCVAQTGDTTGPPGCDAGQTVNLGVTAGNLTQRVYTTASNPGPNTVNLGSVVTPTAPLPVYGTLNQTVVTDTRGGTFGWSLTATLTDFSGIAPTHFMGRWRLAATPSCAPAGTTTAYDYDATGTATIAGFDPTSVAPGQLAGSASQNFSGAVNLCTKDTTPNATTGSTGGVYNVNAALVLTVPSFQATDDYKAVMTISLV